MANNALATWFEYLVSMHDHVRYISHLADNDVKRFLHQRPLDVLPTLELQESLSLFWDSHFLQRIPIQVYERPTFRTLLEGVVGNRDPIVRLMFYSLAIKYQPDLSKLSPHEFGATAPSRVLSSPAAQEALFERIAMATPMSFFPLTEANRARFKAMLAKAVTIDDAVKDTMANGGLWEPRELRSLALTK